MGFTPYSQMVNLAQWTDPMDLNMYAKGIAYKEEIAKENLKNLSNSINSLKSAPAYGVDAEQLQKINDEMRSRLNSINVGNLSDLNTFSQIKGIINDFSNRQDYKAIYTRGSLYNRELERKRKAEEKNQSYTSPVIDSLEEYYNGKNFYSTNDDLDLSSGWTSAPVKDFMKETREAVKKKVLNTKTGVVEEIIDPTEARNYFMGLASSNPNFKKQLMYDFKRSTKGTDWQSKGKEFIDAKMKEAQASYSSALLSGDLDGQAIYKKEIQRLSSMADPSVVGDELKNQYFNSWIDKEFDKIGYSMDIASFVDYKRDPLQMEAIRTANDVMLKNLESANNINEALIKEYIEAGYDPYTKKPLTAGGKKIAEIKQKQQKKATETEADKQRRFAKETMERRGGVTQDVVSSLAEKGESAVMQKEGDTWFVTINKAKLYDVETGQSYEYKEPPRKVRLEDYIESRMGKENTPEFVYRINKPRGSAPTSPSDLVRQFEQAASNNPTAD